MYGYKNLILRIRCHRCPRSKVMASCLIAHRWRRRRNARMWMTCASRRDQTKCECLLDDLLGPMPSILSTIDRNVCVCLLPVRAKAKIRGNKYGATRSAGDYRRKVQLARLCAWGGEGHGVCVCLLLVRAKAKWWRVVLTFCTNSTRA